MGPNLLFFIQIRKLRNPYFIYFTARFPGSKMID